MTPADVTTLVTNLGLGTTAAAAVAYGLYWYATRIALPESEAKQKAFAALPTLVERIGVTLKDVSEKVDGSAARLEGVDHHMRFQTLTGRNQLAALERLAELHGDPKLRDVVAEQRALQHMAGDDSGLHVPLSGRIPGDAPARPRP